MIKNIRKFIEEDMKGEKILSKIKNLSLIKFNEDEFIRFIHKLDKYLKQIAKEYLEKKNV